MTLIELDFTDVHAAVHACLLVIASSYGASDLLQGVTMWQSSVLHHASDATQALLHGINQKLLSAEVCSL